MSDDPYLNMPAPDTSEGVQLPFDALYLSWENGQPALRELGGLACFGGWSAKVAGADKIDGLTLPQSFGKYTRNFKGGKSEPCYGSRAVTVSILGSRQRWVNRDDDRDGSMDYRPGDTKHIQWLCAMFLTPDLATYVPVVLTTKGTQCKRIEAAQKEWREAINATDSKLGRYPISAFAITIGSFGQQPTYETVGDGSKTFTITPIKAPATIAEPAKRLIPRQLVSEFTELRIKANDWLVAWNKRYGAQAAAQTFSNSGPAVAGEDIPF